MRERVLELKERRGAVILAHNYQLPEVQEVADFVGDSLALAQRAKDADAEVVLLCGVSFMAEMAKLLAPDKLVLHPVPHARCPMADMVSPEDVLALKAENPDAPVVAYVNTNLEVKALADVCCTSRNAVEVVSRLGKERVVLVPDENLARFVESRLPGVKVVSSRGYCYVHAQMSPEDARAAKSRHPGLPLVVHPECPPEVQELADQVLSTGQMVRYASREEVPGAVVGTEVGLVERLRRLFPEKEFWTLGPPRVCHNMKKITLREVLRSLEEMVWPVELDPRPASKAAAALERMFQGG